MSFTKEQIPGNRMFRRFVTILPALALVAGCIETVEGTTETAIGTDSGSGISGGRVTQTTDGDYIFVLRRGTATCTARFEGVATAGVTDAEPLACTNGERGNTVVLYGSDGTPSRVTYYIGGERGALNF